MKIAEVVATYPPSHGGMGYVCFHNARELARRGHDVTVFTLDYGFKTPETEQNDFRVVRLGTPFRMGDAGVVPQLYAKLSGFDILHLHYPFYGGAEYVYLSSLLRRQRYFLTYHMDVAGTTALKKVLLGVYDALLMNKIIRRADRVGALTMEHLRSSKAARCVDWNRVVEIPNGVDTEKFRPRPKNRELMEMHGLEGRVVALFVGNLQPFKGLHLLIDAVAELRTDELVLLIVGGGYGEKQYRDRVRMRRIEHRVIFAGPQSPDGRLPDYYNLGDFLVLPSTHSEAFPLVVMEAFSSGIPVIVSSLPGPSRLIEAGKDGLIATVGDSADLRNKIDCLVRDREGRTRMGNAGRQKILNDYSWTRIGERLENILFDIVRT